MALDSYIEVQLEQYSSEVSDYHQPENPKIDRLRLLHVEQTFDTTQSDRPVPKILDIMEIAPEQWDADELIGHVELQWDYTIPEYELARVGMIQQ